MLTLLLRDWRARARQPLLWALAAGFVVLTTFFFLLQIEHYQHLRPLLHRQDNPPGASDLILVPWAFNTVLGLMVLVPMLAGRAFVAEYRQGMLPLLVGWHLPAWQWLLARWLGWLLPLTLLVLLLACMPLSLRLAGPLDLGRVLPSLLAVWLCVAGFSATAVAWAAWIRDPGMASLAAFLFLLLLWVLDWSARSQGVSLDAAIFGLSLFEHFRRMNAGIIHAADLAWFAGFIGLMLAAGGLRLAALKQSPARAISRVLPLLALWLAGCYALAGTGWRLDTSWQQRLSLQPATLALLARIDEPVEITAWASQDAQLRQRIRRFLAPWQQTQPLLQLRFRDPAEETDTARQLVIRTDGTLLLQQGERLERLEHALDEAALARALWRLTLRRHERVAILECPGCGDTKDTTPAGYSTLAHELRMRGLQPLPLDPSRVADIPLSTRLLILIGDGSMLPRTWWPTLDRWLQRGGSLLWLADVDAAETPPPIWSHWGLQVEQAHSNRLIPPRPASPDLATPPALPGPLSWRVEASAPWQPLWYCREQACALAREQILADGRHSRVLLVGDSDFARNRWLDRPVYTEVLMALLGWLVQAEEAFTLPILRAPDTELDIPPAMQARLGVAWLLAIPALLLLAGWLLRLKPCSLESDHDPQD